MGGDVDYAPALLPADPEAGHFKSRGDSTWVPGVALDTSDPIDPPPPPQVHLPMPGPPPPPSPPLRSGEIRDRRKDRSVILPDGSQFRMSRRSSRSRASRPQSKQRESSSEDASEKEE